MAGFDNQVAPSITGQTAPLNNSLINSDRSSSRTVYAAGGEDILATLLQQLANGGTPEMQVSRANRNQEITQVRADRAGYSKQQAQIDAAAAVEAQQRRALEELLPSINMAARGAGTSQSSMRALLLQDAAQKAADSAALLGLENVKTYGNISTNLSGILEALTRENNPQTNALLQALEISKGNQAFGEANRTVTRQPTNSGGIAYATPTRGRQPSRAYDSNLQTRPSTAMSYAPPELEIGDMELAQRNFFADTTARSGYGIG